MLDDLGFARTLAELQDMGLIDAAKRLQTTDPDLVQLNDNAIGSAHRLMSKFGLQGVPAIIAQVGSDQVAIDANTLYAGPAAVLASLGLA
ncbi:hypothetical protein [Pacificibacter maritimus]|uniref:hypothetical protein n=1 Tax=Pacificibacter maritimus TaxID=762213 RepID=UPI000F4D5D34|nr:hypothetical protein [Pacificibacter maritimus]